MHVCMYVCMYVCTTLYLLQLKPPLWTSWLWLGLLWLLEEAGRAIEDRGVTALNMSWTRPRRNCTPLTPASSRGDEIRSLIPWLCGAPARWPLVPSKGKSPNALSNLETHITPCWYVRWIITSRRALPFLPWLASLLIPPDIEGVPIKLGLLSWSSMSAHHPDVRLINRQINR